MSKRLITGLALVCLIAGTPTCRATESGSDRSASKSLIFGTSAASLPTPSALEASNQATLEVLHHVSDYYESAFQKLVLVLLIVGVGAPLLIEVWARKLRERDASALLDKARLQVEATVERHRADIARELDAERARVRQEAEQTQRAMLLRTHTVMGAALLIQGNLFVTHHQINFKQTNEPDIASLAKAAHSFALACDELLKGSDDANLQICLQTLTTVCLPHLRAAQLPKGVSEQLQDVVMQLKKSGVVRKVDWGTALGEAIEAVLQR